VLWKQEMNETLLASDFPGLRKIEESDFPSEVIDIFQVLSDYGGGLTTSDIGTLLEIDDMDFIRRTVAWGDALSFLKLDREGLWRL